MTCMGNRERQMSRDVNAKTAEVKNLFDAGFERVWVFVFDLRVNRCMLFSFKQSIEFKKKIL